MLNQVPYLLNLSTLNIFNNKIIVSSFDKLIVLLKTVGSVAVSVVLVGLIVASVVVLVGVLVVVSLIVSFTLSKL